MVDSPLATEAAPLGLQAIGLRLTGLTGGHSGIDIHRQRGNAIKLLAQFLHGLAQKGFDFRLMSMVGGTAHNAIPREAEAVLRAENPSLIQAEAENFVARLRSQLNEEESGVRIDVEILPAQGMGNVLTNEAAHRVLSLLHD